MMQLLVSTFLYGSICFLTVIFLWSWTWIRYGQLPPGPRPWPIVGNLFDLREGALSFRHLAEQYGPIFTVWMGSRPLIIISGAEAMHEALINQADSFSRRPKLYATKHVTCDFRTVLSSSGLLWRTLRRNLVFQVLNSERVRTYESVRDSELQNLVERFRQEARDNDGVVCVLPHVRKSMFRILTRVCFGEQVDENMLNEFDALGLERIRRLLGSLDNYFLSVRLWNWLRLESITSLLQRSQDLVLPWIVKARETMRAGGTVSGRYLETLLQMQAGSADAKGLDGPLTDANIIALCFELVNGGTDTTASTLESVLARIVSHPNVQQKLVDEIQSVLGEKTVDEAATVDCLPYLQAVIKETLRLHPTAHLALPYAASRPGVKIGGFLVPESAVVVIWTGSLCQDVKIWGDPENFRPERFMDDMAHVDLRGGKKIALLPFGLGKRTCPGMNFAMLHVSRMTALLVQTFEWSFAGNTKPDVTMTVPACSGVGFSRLNSRLKIRIRERRSRIETENASPDGR